MRQRINRAGVSVASYQAAKVHPGTGERYGRNGAVRGGRTVTRGVGYADDTRPRAKGRTLSAAERETYAKTLAERPSHFATRKMGAS